jgi:hypothetical protein
MKFFKKVFGQEEVKLTDLLKAAKELEGQKTELEGEGAETKSKLMEMEAQALASGEETEALLQARQRVFSYSSRIEAVTNSLDELKVRILKELPKERESRLQKLDKEEAKLRKQQKDLLPELFYHLSHAAVFLEMVTGTSADGWASPMVPFLAALKGIVEENRHDFDVALKKAKDETPTYREGNLESKIGSLVTERANLMRRTYTEKDVQAAIEAGEFPLGPSEPVQPIRPVSSVPHAEAI